MLGILLIDKPSGMTSHDVVAAVRRRLGVKRVGHAGTLDPLATGLLVVAVGPATRLLRYMPLEPKEYVARVTFGKRSSTLDGEGEIEEGGQIPENLESAIEQVLPEFMGEVQQVPPMLSAVKVKGKPLYKYAREGKEVDREERTIVVESIRIEAASRGEATLRVVCSGGTYVRTLMADIGDRIGCGAYLSQLARTRTGEFQLGDAVILDDVAPGDLIPVERALGRMATVNLNSAQTEAFRRGQRVGTGGATLPQKVAVRDPNGAVFGIASLQGEQLQPECVLPQEAGVA